MKFGDIEIIFNESADQQHQSKTSDWIPQEIQQVEPDLQLVNEHTDQASDEEEQQWLSQLMIDDPVGYEQMIIDNRMEADRGHDEATRD